MNMNISYGQVAKITDLRALSHDALLSATGKLAAEERRVTLEVLHHLREIERRRAYAKLGYPSLWEYAVKALKYSESSAYRRISAMRALNDHPELEEKIQQGTLSITSVSQVQTFIKAELNQAHKSYNSTQKKELFKKCESKSSREVTRELITISPLAFKIQKERVLSENRTELSFVVDAQLLGKIHRVRDLSVNRLKNPGSYPELMDLMSEMTLEEIDPLRKEVKKSREFKRGGRDEGKFSGSDPAIQARSGNADREVGESEGQGQNALPAPQPTDKSGYFAPEKSEDSTTVASFRRVAEKAQADTGLRRPYIPGAVRTQIWRESGGRCTYQDLKTGARCSSTFGLEIEHCKPHSLGGSSADPGNLRLLCKAHNQWQAIQSYGLSKMEPYLSKDLHRRCDQETNVRRHVPQEES